MLVYLKDMTLGLSKRKPRAYIMSKDTSLFRTALKLNADTKKINVSWDKVSVFSEWRLCYHNNRILGYSAFFRFE